MTRLVGLLVLVIVLLCRPSDVNAQAFVAANTPATASAGSARLTPLGWYGAIGAACTGGVSVAQSIALNRLLTGPELARNGLSCFLGPPGWFLANAIFPELVAAAPTPPPRGNAPRRRFNPPPAGEARFVANEVLLRVDARASDAYLQNVARRLGMTRLDSQTFTLTGHSIQRWRIDSGRTVRSVIASLARYSRIAVAQPNYLFALQQDQAPPAPRTQSDNARQPSQAQYVVNKLHVMEAHRLTSGANIAVAVVDSMIDANHPELTGIVSAQFDAAGGPAEPHVHGTGMAGAIAANGRLIGIAPKVKILAVRAFGSQSVSAEATTFNLLKSLDWSAAQGARIINMSFAGPADPMMREMLARADARGIVLIAAVGNAGPRSPPLYPAADRHVIGVTATDSEDHLLPVANRGPQVAIAAPGVDILLPSPGNGYQVTSGTSVAAAHVSGIVALMLARNAALKPADVRRILTASVTPLGASPRSPEFGAGLVDALKAVHMASP